VAVLDNANKISIPPNKTGISTTYRPTTGDGPTLFEIIGAFKSITTHHYINGVKQNNWQPFRKRFVAEGFEPGIDVTNQLRFDVGSKRII